MEQTIRAAQRANITRVAFANHANPEPSKISQVPLRARLVPHTQFRLWAAMRCQIVYATQATRAPMGRPAQCAQQARIRLSTGRLLV